MHYVVVPADITIHNLATGEAVPGPQGKPVTANFKDFVYQRLADAKFVEGKPGTEGAFFAFDTKTHLDAQDWTPGAVVAFEDEEWKRLVESTKAPTGGYRPEFQVSFVPFMRAVLEAPTTKPADPAPEPAAAD